MSALAAEVVLKRGMSRFISFYFTFVVQKATNACTFFRFSMTLEQRGFRRLMVNPPIFGFGFGHTGFDFPSQKIGFSLLMVKVRRFDVGCTNGVRRFAYHLMRMVLTIAQGGRY